MKNIKLLLISLVFYILSAFGISLTIAANVGVSSFNSLNLSLANLMGIKIGTVTMLVNGCFLVVYMVLTTFKKRQSYLLQALAVYTFGFVINFFTYTLLSHFSPASYLFSLLTFITGTLIAGFSTGIVLSLNVLAFPLESVCRELADRTRFSFANFRYGVDIICVMVSISLSLATSSPLLVREGTLISLLLLSWAINTTKRLYEQQINPQLSANN